MIKKPNILWLMTDEQRPDSLGCYGSTWAKTSNIDRIAKKGVVMQNAVCQSPVCVPSRSSQMLARYPHEFACLNNMLLIAGAGGELPQNYITFIEIFNKDGYDTVNFGRYHSMAKDAFGTNEKMPDALEEYCTYFGLNEKYEEGEFHVLKRPGEIPRSLVIAGTYPGDTDPNEISTNRAIKFLKEREDNNNPFLMRVSFNWPHTPTLARPPYDKLYDPNELPIVYYDNEARKKRAEYDKTYASLHRMDLLTKKQSKQLWKDYMGCCAYIDHLVGNIMDVLEKEGMLENTIIIYSADHGKSLGEWGSAEKGTFDQEVWRVPFIWSWPGHIPEGEVRNDCCEIIDTSRTVLDLAGLADKIPDSYRGRNLFGKEIPPEYVFGVIRAPIEDIPDLDPRLMRIGVRNQRYRMDINFFMDGSIPQEEMIDGNLFDLEKDSLEKKNIWNDDCMANVKKELIDAIVEWIKFNPIDDRLKNPVNAGQLF